jgi:DNA polymerase-1
MPTRSGLDAFREVWLVGFEFAAPPGERPDPVCLVAREYRTGRTLRLWRDDLRDRREPPYPIGPDVLFVAYYAAAELGCHLALGWPLPARILDLFAEFRNRTNGLSLPHGTGLLGALAWHGLDVMAAAGNAGMRRLVHRDGSGMAAEREADLGSCDSGVSALALLLPAMLPELDLPRALLRGRYMGSVARMEWAGVPIDVETLARLRAGWESIRDRLIREVDARFGVFDGRTFKAERWADWLARNVLPWPRTETGALALDDDTFREMARAHPDVAPIRELRVPLSPLRLSDLTIGADGRNRSSLCAFRSKTGRNQPSSTRFILGTERWIRGLIRPESGRAVAYVDWVQQEFGIAAALSEDPAMIDAYRSGDPYLKFAKQAGLVPPDGTKATHGPVREQSKGCVLGSLYGLGERSLALRIGQPVAWARQLLRLHRQTYAKFWAWSDGVEHHAMLLNRLHTVFGWTVHVGPDANPRSLRNFVCQGNGAEMLRLACCLATERGITVVAPIHDAVMVEGPADAIDEVVARTRDAMAEASEVVLDGFRLRSEATIVRWPGRYMDDRGRGFWGRVVRLLPDPAEFEDPTILPIPSRVEPAWCGPNSSAIAAGS